MDCFVDIDYRHFLMFCLGGDAHECGADPSAAKTVPCTRGTQDKRFRHFRRPRRRTEAYLGFGQSS